MLVVLLVLAALPALPVAVFGWRRAVGWCAPASWALLTVVGAFLAARVVADGPVTNGDGFLRADALSAFMIIVIGAVAILAGWSSVGYIETELAHGHTSPSGARLYGLLVPAFVAAMVLAVLAANMGIMWVAVEATTIATVFLVGHRRSRASLEASWKYVIIGSVGIAVAFLGTVLVAYAATHAGVPSGDALRWDSLVDAAARLDPGVMRLATFLLVIGYGTKVGLAPMHTWLPDAHSQAPAPVSALMSGVLLSVAFYAILRVKRLADPALGTAYLRGILAAAALLSLFVAASLLIRQRDYKRLLAYSSIEHMGLVALAAAIGTPLAAAALLLHVLAHALGKSVLFLSSGEILFAEGTTQINPIRGLLARAPVLGGSFGLALLALLGFPPFALFASEVAIARAGFAAGMGWVTAAALILLIVAFAAVITHGQRMLLGDPAPHAPAPRLRPTAAAPLIAGLGALAVLGITVWPLRTLLDAAAQVVTG